jgi:hypothetical protein
MKTTPTLKLSAMAACTLMLLGSHPAAHAASNWTQIGADVFGLPDGIYRSQGMTTDGTNGTVEDLFSVKQPFDQEVEGLSVTADADGNAVVNVLVVNDPKNTGNALDENVTLYHYDSVSAVPEPQTCALMLGGLAMLGFVGKRRRPTSGSARS